MNKEGEVCIIDVRNADDSISQQDPIMRIPFSKSKITSLLWGPLDETVIVGNNLGHISLWDIRVKLIMI